MAFLSSLIKDLSPEAIKLGYDFLVTMQEKVEIITKIEQLPPIGEMNDG